MGGWTLGFWGPRERKGLVTYSYKDAYGNLYDLKFPMGEAPAETTVDFGRITVRRVFTANAVHFKGSGFYSNGG